MPERPSDQVRRAEPRCWAQTPGGGAGATEVAALQRTLGAGPQAANSESLGMRERAERAGTGALCANAVCMAYHPCKAPMVETVGPNRPNCPTSWCRLESW